MAENEAWSRGESEPEEKDPDHEEIDYIDTGDNYEGSQSSEESIVTHQ